MKRRRLLPPPPTTTTTPTTMQVSQEHVLDFVMAHIEHYTAPGGLLLVVYTCVQSHPRDGAAGVRAEVRSSGSQGPLITGPFTLCTSELLSLMLRGSGDGNVGVRAYVKSACAHDARACACACARVGVWVG